MQRSEAIDNPALQKMVEALKEAVGDSLVSVVVYGSAARGDFHRATSDFNLLVVLEDLDTSTLEKVSPLVSKWLRDKQPFPRFFTPALISDSADVFPIEFLDIKTHQVVLHGEDPVSAVDIRRDHLRLQCERELREKMMRLREGFMEAQGNPKALTALLTSSYTTFVALFRGCLYLLGGDIPVHNHEVVTAFCSRAEIDAAPFQEVDRLKKGEKLDADPKSLFSRYYEELRKAVHRVDRFQAE